MIGAFRSTTAAMGGLLFRRRFRLTAPQKYRLNRRLKEVDDTVAAVTESGVRIHALYDALQHKTQSEMTPREKYWVESKRFANGMKPIHWTPHWVKMPHPSAYRNTPMHKPILPRDGTFDRV